MGFRGYKAWQFTARESENLKGLLAPETSYHELDGKLRALLGKALVSDHVLVPFWSSCSNMIVSIAYITL